MRPRHIIVSAAALLFCAGIAWASVVAKPFRSAGGMQTVPQASWGGTDGSSGFYSQLDAGAVYHASNGTETPLSSGGGSGTVTSVATDSTLSGGPISTSGTLGIALGHANTWTATQTFPTGSITASELAVPFTGYTVTATKTSAYSASLGDYVRCDPSGGNFTVTLPTAASNSGKQVAAKIINGSNRAVVVVPQTGQTIDGATSYTLLGSFASVQFISDGTNWMVL